MKQFSFNREPNQKHVITTIAMMIMVAAMMIMVAIPMMMMMMMTMALMTPSSDLVMPLQQQALVALRCKLIFPLNGVNVKAFLNTRLTPMPAGHQ